MTRRPPPLHFTPLADVTDEEVDWLVPGLMPVGALTCLDGEPGTGKSTLTGELTARLTVGAPLPAAPPRAPTAVAIVNPEDPGSTIKRRIEAAGGDPDLVRLIEKPGPRTDRAVDLGRDLDRIRGHFDVVDLLIVENVGLALGRSGRTEVATRTVLHRVNELARRTRTAVVGIRHLRKGSGSALHRGAGFVAIAGAARSVTLLAPDPLDPGSLVWCSVKTNFGPTPPALTLRIVPNADRQATVEWTGTAHPTRTTLRTSNRPKLDVARQLLEKTLAGGPVRSSIIKQAADRVDVSWRTVEQVKADLGIVSRQIPEPGVQGRGPSWWALPGTEGWTDA